MRVEVSDHILTVVGELHSSPLSVVLKKLPKDIDSKKVSAAVYELTRHGYITRSNSTKNAQISMTEKGYQKLQTNSLKNLNFNPKKWDKRWRIVMYDIPESERSKRDALRGHLQTAGFQQMHSGVWVHPGRCDDYVERLKQALRLKAGQLTLVVATKITDSSHLHKQFGLG